MSVLIGEPLSFGDVIAVARDGASVACSPDLADRLGPARAIVEQAVSDAQPIYGINTGLGDLANVRIEPTEAAELQRDIVRAHATAVGPFLPRDVVRAMLLLKARTFAFGASGVRRVLVERLVDFLNAGITPVVPSQGSLGASGDLALLAHLALPLIGEGRVEYEDGITSAADGLERAGIDPVVLEHKEGLSLVNGTEAMLAMGMLAYDRAATIARTADVTAAMSVEALLGTDRAFDERVVALRKHAGPPAVADNLRRLLAGSPIVASHRDSDHLVQDAYSLRCIPQVHGAYRDALDYVRMTLEAELASAIDNPSVIVETGEVLSGGNFHGEALGLALDHLALCVSGFATIAERRIARLVDPDLSNGLPAFLTPDPGRRTGFMIAHYTAASLTSENKSLAHPASVDTIPTSAGQEDHVSMGATAARKCLAILDNTEHVIAIEALGAAQGLDLRSMDAAPATHAARACVRAVSAALDDDRSLADEIGEVRALVADGTLAAAAESKCGALA